MSEPLSSHEIEDVLSSIRRLVSEDLRPAVRATGAAAPVAVVPAGKLVLTQALRVVPSEGMKAASADRGDEAAPEPTRPGDRAAVTDLDTGDSGPDALPETSVPTEVEREMARVSEALIAEEDDVVWAAPGEMDPTEEEPEAVPPAAAGFRRGHWTAETVPQVDWMQSDEDWIEDEPAQFSAHPRAGAAAGLAGDPLARAWADRAEAEVHAVLEEKGVVPPAQPAATAEPPAGPGLFDGAEPMVDEEVLRDIVREIIREELAGTLGERITRNVRKLVRVEINRALTAREFE